jgi:hypothetical protein
VGDALIRADRPTDRRMDRRTDMTKSVGASRDYENAPKNQPNTLLVARHPSLYFINLIHVLAKFCHCKGASSSRKRSLQKVNSVCVKEEIRGNIKHYKLMYFISSMTCGDLAPYLTPGDSLSYTDRLILVILSSV